MNTSQTCKKKYSKAVEIQTEMFQCKDTSFHRSDYLATQHAKPIQKSPSTQKKKTP